MKRLYRLVIQGWIPVEVEEDDAAHMGPAALQYLYEDCNVNPYDLDECVLRLEPATAADCAKYAV
jgi:hypothetical protein